MRVGNDIVDLAVAPKLEGRRGKRWIEKVCSLEEQFCFVPENIHQKTVWRLWSMKESAYKAHKQLEPDSVFSPHQTLCIMTNLKDGLVMIDGRTYVTRTITSEDFVYTTASSDQETPPITRAFKLASSYNKDQGLEVRAAALSDAAEQLHVPLSELNIHKDEAHVPRLNFGKDKHSMMISFTHHCDYAGYALSLSSQK